jgi:hypothetical protein
MNSKRPRFWFLIFLLPVIALVWWKLQPRVTYTHYAAAPVKNVLAFSHHGIPGISPKRRKNMATALSVKYLLIADSSTGVFFHPASDFLTNAPLLCDNAPRDTTSGYSETSTSKTHQVSFLYDLGPTPPAIRQLDMTLSYNNCGIAYSNNGTTWTQIFTNAPLHSPEGLSFTFSPVTARYWQGTEARFSATPIAYSVGMTDVRLYDSVGALISAPTFTPPTAPPSVTFGTVGPITIPVIVPALSGGATSYDLQRAPDAAGSAGTWATIQSTVTPSATYTDTPVQPRTKYWYRLVATNSAGSTNGPSASATTTPIPVPSLTGTAILQSNIPGILLSGS